MANILLSYAHEDLEIINKLGNILENYGHTIVIPYDESVYRETFHDDFLKQVKSSDFFVAVFSKNTSDFSATEISKAIGYCRESKKPFLALVFDEAVPKTSNYLFFYYASREKLSEAAERISNYISQSIGISEAIEEEKKKTISRVTEKADTYIRDSLKRLAKKEKVYQIIAYICYSLCGASLIFAVVLLLFKANYILTVELSTSKQIQFGLLGFVILALVISISRFLFLIGKSFMVESLRNSDRIHAISFGDFYLKAYGDKAEWDEIKEAFQHWNIDKGSAFISQSANDFDPEIFKNIIEFTKVLTKKS